MQTTLKSGGICGILTRDLPRGYENALALSRGGCFALRPPRRRWRQLSSGLETTQGQIHGLFSEIPYKFHQNRVASVGD